MKKLLRFYMTTIGSLLLCSVINAQAPQSFNFQAVARDNSGELIDDQSLDVRISLIANSDESLAWQETHNVTTSDLGLFSLDIGSGTRTGGDATSFSELSWNEESYSIKVELKEGSAWEDMGTSELLSVPYALSAASVGELKSLEVVEDAANPVDSALFEVKNNSGNTVFAVYNEGVRVYVDDTQGKSKGNKGGFAIGGFDTEAKGTTWEYFRVTPDSVRIYLDERSTKGPKGGFAIGGFDTEKGITEDIMHMSEENYFIGYESGSNITTGLYNSFFGYQAGVMDSSGSNNLFMGYQTGYNNTEGSYNVFLGTISGYSNISGLSNVFIGQGSGYTNDEGSYNVFLGTLAGNENTSGQQNVYLGQQAGEYSSEGSYNVAIGTLSGRSNSEGLSNVFIGNSSGMNTTTGSFNVIIGTLAGSENITGEGNVYVGQQAGRYNTEGSYNVVVGDLAGENNLTGEKNIFLGYTAGYNETESNRLYIDNYQNDTYNAYIYGRMDESYISFNSRVDIWEDLYVNWTIYELNNNGKSPLKSSGELSAVMDKLKLVTPHEYTFSKDQFGKRVPATDKMIGLDPDEIEDLFPYLVGQSETGAKGISYSKLSVVLLQALKEQQQIIEDQEARLDAMEEKLNMILEQQD